MRKIAKTAIILAFGILTAFSAYAGDQDGFTKSPSGMRYKIFKVSKDTSKPVTGDWITIDMRYSAMMKGKDSLLFDSRTQMKGDPVKMELPASDFRGDLYEGIRMLSPGDSGIFMITNDSLYTMTFRMPSRPETIDSNTAVTFIVHLIAAENAAQLKIKEEDALKKYLADNKVTVAPSASGIYIIKTQEGEGVKIDTGYSVTLQFVVSLINGKPIFSSYTRPEPLKFEYGKRFDTPGLSEAIGTMKKGEKAKVIVPYAMGFGEKGRGALVPAYATLLYEVEILNVQSKEELEKEVAAEQKRREEQQVAAMQGEQLLLDKYIKDNNITVKPLPSGLYFIEKVQGTGPQAMAGKTVKVHYTGTLLDGTKFDSSVDRGTPIEFVLGQGRVIAGWEEGLALMKQGGKAQLIVPSKIAYAEVGKGSIQPYTTLVFEVEMVEVK